MANLSNEALMKQREKAITKSSFSKIIVSFIDEKTRAGVVVSQSNYGKSRVKAHFFRPAQKNTCFHEEEIESAHDTIGLLKKLQDKLSQEKAEKVAGHDFQVGDILASIWGWSMQDVSFLQVVSIPHPRKVNVVEMNSTLVSGDWMNGMKAPVLPEDGSLAQGLISTRDTQVINGTSTVKTNSTITRCTKWTGKPVSVYSD
jgi:hypothetical protein